jgi:hypothetical protein
VPAAFSLQASTVASWMEAWNALAPVWVMFLAGLVVGQVRWLSAAGSRGLVEGRSLTAARSASPAAASSHEIRTLVRQRRPCLFAQLAAGALVPAGCGLPPGRDSQVGLGPNALSGSLACNWMGAGPHGAAPAAAACRCREGPRRPARQQRTPFPTAPPLRPALPRPPGRCGTTSCAPARCARSSARPSRRRAAAAGPSSGPPASQLARCSTHPSPATSTPAPAAAPRSGEPAGRAAAKCRGGRGRCSRGPPPGRTHALQQRRAPAAPALDCRPAAPPSGSSPPPPAPRPIPSPHQVRDRGGPQVL